MKNIITNSGLIKTNLKLFLLLIFLFGLEATYTQILPWKNILKANTNSFYTIAISKESNKLYVSSDNRYLFKTTDNGVSFDTTFNSYNSVKAFLPINNELIISGQYGSSGVLKSTDDGNTWTSIYPIWRITELYNNGNDIWGGTEEGEIILSSDLGNEWTKLNSPTTRKINSFLADSTIIFLGSYYNGYFFSTDRGLSWNRILDFSGIGFIRQDSKRGMWLMSNDTLFYTPSFGKDWTPKGTFSNSRYFEIDKYDNLYVSCYDGLFRSENYGTSWGKIAAYKSDKIVFSDSTIFIMDYNSIYVHVPGYKPLHEKNMFPLSVNSIYQYFVNRYGNHSGYSYGIGTRKVIRDTSINALKYFKFSNSESWYRYDPDSNRAFIRQNGNEGLYCDFNLLNGETFEKYDPKYNVYLTTTIFEDSIKIFGSNRNTIEWYNHQWGYYNYENFANNIGIIDFTDGYSGSGPDYEHYSKLISALIYDSTGNYSYYSEDIKPEIVFSPLNKLSLYDSNNFTMQVSHKYNRNSTPYSGEIVYIDTVFIEYSNNNSVGSSPVKFVGGARTPLTSDYKFSLLFDTSAFKLDDTVKYRIVTRDIQIIPKYFYEPSDGYFTAAIGSLNSFRDENTEIKSYLLYNNYPNPFNPTTFIKYDIVKNGNVSLKVYDVLGNEVATLVNEEKQPGSYEVEFQSTVGNQQLASGIYFYQLRAGEFVQTKKMVLLR